MKYTRKVTIVWSVFFLVNGLIAAYTTFFCDLETWTFYNGFVSYCLMAILGASEWIIRQRVKR
ncbi:hypothetical protein QX776_06930 [Alteromonadaceae bacterium BrNp21-10]|nr:hypothetical protein [Alteromonadaceae bacterium BrNp21-10]